MSIFLVDGNEHYNALRESMKSQLRAKLVAAKGLTLEEQPTGQMILHVLERVSGETAHLRDSIDGLLIDASAWQWYLFKVQDSGTRHLLNIINPGYRRPGLVPEFYKLIETVDHALGRFALEVEGEPART